MAGGASVALGSAALGTAQEVPALLVLGVMVTTSMFGLSQPSMVGAIDAAVPPDVRGIALGIAIMTFFVAGGIGSAVVGGFGARIGVAATLMCLAVYPALSAALIWPLARPGRESGT